MPIYVKSEIAQLKRVMLHRPGQELEHLTPGTLDRLLFDDIPYLAVAQEEHDRLPRSCGRMALRSSIWRTWRRRPCGPTPACGKRSFGSSSPSPPMWTTATSSTTT